MSELVALVTAAAQQPDDDAPRLVLQDALLERRDPRGEFIALQFKALRLEDTADDRVRLAQLEKAHRTRWLGRLAPFVDEASVRFDRGFLARVALKPQAFSSEGRARWRDEPTLPLLRELRVPAGVPATALAEALREPALAQLAVVTCEDRRLLEALARTAAPWTFRGVGVVGTVRQVMELLDRVLPAPAFTQLDGLVLELERFGRSAALELSKRLARSPFRPRCARLDVRVDVDGEVLGYASSVVAAAWPGATLTLESQSLTLRARRTEGNRLDVDLVGSHAPEPMMKAIGAMFGALGVLRVHQRGRSEPATLELDWLRSHLRRLRAARVSLPAAWGMPDDD
ncbi:MAG: TIGR02996 domain-containing protein [Myxococcaceae bacterium]|nr:TIGR02996 domain-containing protein [Myxococcaceae bacterium]